ncbi:LacI family DNA-binding transcriptional regulator [Morganella morganii]|uniref:LacI family DNA-binding transcriptional regulator n=1 Tax=Morganella morganii TaxID=582 RepID=UPI00236757FA|nr:LacI family DNA-binding transcriptional regulator [Morganella morganii]
MVFLKDVAKLAEVSMMTVSRAINKPDKLKKETLARVQDAIRKTGYTPDLSARMIRSSRSGQGPRTIGVLALDTATSPFCVDIILSVEETARSYGWNSYIVNMLAEDNPESIADLLLSHRPDGIIFTTMGLRQVEISGRMLKVPLVLANCESVNTSTASYIPDDENGQYDAVSALLKAGRRRPLCLYLPAEHPATARRIRGLTRAFRDYGEDTENLLHHYLSDEHYADIPDVVRRYIRHGKPEFDSVICGNDRIAFIVYQILLACGLNIPADVAVIGYDNMVGIGGLFIPPLSTVQLPHYEIGRQSALHIIHGETHRDTVCISSPWLSRASV